MAWAGAVIIAGNRTASPRAAAMGKLDGEDGSEGFRTAAKEMGPRIPEDIRTLTLAEAMRTTEPGKTQGYLDLAKEIYK